MILQCQLSPFKLNLIFNLFILLRSKSTGFYGFGWLEIVFGTEDYISTFENINFFDSNFYMVSGI
jgi:hypothetical protein